MEYSCNHRICPEELVTDLPKLTRTIQSLLLYPDKEGPVSDDCLTSEAMRIEPEFQKEFNHVKIKIRHNTRNVVVLICSPDGKYAWLEDGSWTPYVDCKCYKYKPPRPAEFTLKLKP
jgi:hypothetical protein